ncbi:heavy-metal-associated domain-containing protein [soil metagenome]
MSATTTHVTFAVPSISCGHCEMTIREELGAQAGIVAVEPSHATKSVKVDFDSGTISNDQIRALLAESGYPVEGEI